MIVALVGPTCSGKTTIAKKFISDHNFNKIVTYTTRAPREREVNGEDYYFVSDEEFQRAINNHEFLEYMDYNASFGHVYYGSKICKYDIESDGKYVIILTPEGIRALLNYVDENHLNRNNVVIVYIDIPEYICYERSKRRGDSSIEVLRRLHDDEVRAFIPFRTDKLYDLVFWETFSIDDIIRKVLSYYDERNKSSVVE